MAISLSADSADTADAVPDGVRLAELIARLPLSRDSIFKIVKELAIVTSFGPNPDGRGRVAWLSSTDADRVAAAALAVHRGETRIADLALSLQRQPTQPTPQTPPGTLSGQSADSADSADFLARLQAAERAIRSGLGLTTAETAWILGVRPGSSPLTRAGITATRTGWNCWRLSSADSVD